jgi:hypothetical protein
MSMVSISGTLILNSDLVCTGDVIVENIGLVVPVANKVIETFLSCPTKEIVSANGKSPTITSTTSDITVLGSINGNGHGFPANLGPGANSLLEDNFGIQILFYGATHAGVGYADNVPESYVFMSEEFVLNEFQVEDEAVVLTYPPVNPSSVALNIVTGPPQNYGTDFTVYEDILTWRGFNLDSQLQIGDIIRVVYLGDLLRIIPPPKPPYGSYEAPLSIGSGSGQTSGGSGIRLIARSGSIDVTGSITMNGESGVTPSSGGGSGGSVWLIGYDIIGTGLISANGGDTNYEYAGGGGGGYITFNYEHSYLFSGPITVEGKKGAAKGIIYLDQIKPFFIEKFTGRVLNTKWWEVVRTPVVLNNQVEMDTTAGDHRSPLVQSKFSISGKNITVDLDYIPIGIEPTYFSSFFSLFEDNDNWISIVRRTGYVIGLYSTEGVITQWGIPYPYLPATFRINKSDSTFTFQFIDSSAGPQTIFTEIIPAFEQSRFVVQMGTLKNSDSHIVDYFELNDDDFFNKEVLLSFLPTDASNVALNLINGPSQFYGTDYYVNGQFLNWNSMALDGLLQIGDKLRAEYSIILVEEDLNTKWDNFRVFSGILEGLETSEPTIYVDSTYGSDVNDGLPLTPLQNLFVATAWAKRGGTVVLYDGTYNPTEVIGKTLTIMGANGASPLITTSNVRDSTGSNWERSCLTFKDCQGVVKNVHLQNASEAVYARNTNGIEIWDSTVTDSTVGFRFEEYSFNPKIIRNTIHSAVIAVDMSNQVYAPNIYSNLIYGGYNGIVLTDSTASVVSSNTIDRVIIGIVLDKTSTGVVASNNITNSGVGIISLSDSTMAIYNNNFFGTIIDATGIISDSSGNISNDPLYLDASTGNYHLDTSSPNRGAGTGEYDLFFFDNDKVSRDATYDIGAYEIVDGSHGTGPYYVSSSGDDYSNFGTMLRPYRTLDKAMSVADASIIIDRGHHDSYFLKLKTEAINQGDGSIATFTLDSHYSQININNLIYVSPNGSDSSVYGGDGTHTWGNGSRQYPYRSIDRALQDASIAGTCLIVMSGEYNIFSGRQDVIMVPYADRTGIPDGRYYLQSLFETHQVVYPNHVIPAGSDLDWVTYASGSSDASVREGFLIMSFDGSNSCGVNSAFTYQPQFTVQADLRQAFAPVFFSVHNADNTATLQYRNGDWTSTVTTAGNSCSWWGRLNLPYADQSNFFTDYLCVSSQDINNKFIALSYLLVDSSDVSLNVIGGSSQELGTDFYAEDGKIKWDGLGLDGELNPGDILRVIYRAEGLSSPARFQINLLPTGVIEVRGSDYQRWYSLMKYRLLSDTTNPWTTSFYMDQTGDENPEVFGRGYVSKYYTLATNFENTDQAFPYLAKTMRQPIIVYKITADNS